jgi:drug/metabolite transporter (DMT)-like permease
MSLVDAIVVLAADLPDPGNPSFMTLGAGCGGFLGGLIGHARRHPQERVRQFIAEGGLVGFGAGFVCWLIALAIDRL